MSFHLTLQEIMAHALPQIQAIDTALMNQHPAPNLSKWSYKELIGHLIDSAYNNHQRFLRASSQEDLVMVGYDQNDWVVQNNYQNRSLKEVIEIWVVTNHHLAQLIENLDPKLLHRKTTHHNFHLICMNLLEDKQETSLAYLVWDYLFHIEYHLEQIIPGYEKINPSYRI